MAWFQLFSSFLVLLWSDEVLVTAGVEIKNREI